mmetsp:Transcript_21028/g.58438  ORF Transcript_21028/g.58438 Transcript_21028/m.58438 type:complete len:314 (-) Transcript_21028:330-1271(-)|eukprot:CAMPEP_0202358024 /NCGR_PEP_ID=MMETSP1126-20121109/11825_1 /ASSEMBLY_ACC=CAM_ASM_000457 /TAXON_ID=3047 /ORGANISM="Dunaliella tertiolecta, Strain CCMP1320" /LENGTH=313 /DNA_ID=CAMNT_0048951039 /DNA_START=140 /DNA_END=1081 /DNA_ORIENTATION=-
MTVLQASSRLLASSMGTHLLTRGLASIAPSLMSHAAAGTCAYSTAREEPNAHSTAATMDASFTDTNSASSAAEGFTSVLPKLVIFGARGFVGSHIAQEGLNAGLGVTGVSRSGTPPVRRDEWTNEVDWVRGNALEPRSFEQHLEGAAAVISTVGAFGSQEAMLRTNGTANATLIEAAAKAGVPRFVYVSAHIPNIPGIELVLRGYVQGKAMAEEALRKHYPEGGVALRPGVVYGNRVVSSSLTLPLQMVFQPLDLLLSSYPSSKQFANMPFISALASPPNSVQSVAKAAVDAATNPAVPPGVMDPWEIGKYKE